MKLPVNSKIYNNQNQEFAISLKSSFYLKGMAILLIMLHNFFHLLPPKFGENEMYWSYKHLTGFFKAVADYPFLSIEHFWGLMGFFGVPVFVFLSGYGLTQSLLTSKKKILPFVFKHIVKIYILLLLCVCVFIAFCAYQNTLSMKLLNKLLFTLSLTNNFFPERLFMVNGPWWFFSLIIQLYLLFPVIFYALKNKKNLFWLLAACYFAIYVLLHGFCINPKYVFGNFLGHLPEFMLGCFMARHKEKLSLILNKYCILAALCMVSLSFWFKCLFPLSHIMATVFLIGLFLNIQKYCENKMILNAFNEFLIYVGIISPFLFGFNGFLRKMFYATISNKHLFWDREFAFLKWFALCMLLASLFSIRKIKIIYHKFRTIK